MRLNNKKIIIVLTLFFVILASANVIYAQDETTFKKTNNSLGFNGGFGGNGISYRHYFSEKNSVQLTGSIYTSYQSEINFNGGILYRRVIHQRKRTRLLISSGFSFSNYSQSLGTVLEVEINPAWMDNISTSVSTGYQLSTSNNLNIGPIMSVSLFYNF